jgi:hypothetical protein
MGDPQQQLAFAQQMQMAQALHQHQVQMFFVIFGPIFAFALILFVTIAWLQNLPKMKMIAILKTYAEKGEEPPAGVLEAMGNIRGPSAPPQPPRKQTRADHLAHFAGSLGLALGAGFVIAWRWPLDSQHPGKLLVVAICVAVFFTASAAARLVGALTTHDGD